MVLGGWIRSEVWELENGNNKVITPTLTNYYHSLLDRDREKNKAEPDSRELI